MKKIINKQNLPRLIIQIAFFISMPALFSTAFSGIKYLADQIYKTETISWNPFLATLIVLLAYTIVFGRFFCGYACAFGSLGDWLYSISAFLQKKIRKKPIMIPDKAINRLLYLKYIVLIIIVVLCLTGTYSYVSSADPWELFASFIALRFDMSGKVISAILLGGIVIGMLFVERFFCMFLCPMGAVFALMPIIPFTTFNRKKSECIPGCTLCEKTCPASISFGEKDSKYGDCFQCGRCSVKCPKENIRLGFRKFKGTEIGIVALKAALLFAICYPLMNQ